MVGVLGRERGDQGRGDVGVGGERAKVRDREVLGAAEEDCEVVGRGSHRVVVGGEEGIRDWRRGGIFLSSVSGFRMQYEGQGQGWFPSPAITRRGCQSDEKFRPVRTWRHTICVT